MIWALASGIKGQPLFIPQGRGEQLLTITVGFVLTLMLVRWAGVLLQE
jgi:hypothetical protein